MEPDLPSAAPGTAVEGTPPSTNHIRESDPIHEVNLLWLFDTGARLMATCHVPAAPGQPCPWWIDPEGAIPRQVLFCYLQEPEITPANSRAVAMWSRKSMLDLAMGIVRPEELKHTMTSEERQVYEEWHRALRPTIV